MHYTQRSNWIMNLYANKTLFSIQEVGVSLGVAVNLPLGISQNPAKHYFFYKNSQYLARTMGIQHPRHKWT